MLKDLLNTTHPPVSTCGITRVNVSSVVFEYQCGENFSTTLTTLLSFKTYHIKYLIIRTFAKETSPRSVVPKVGAGTRLVGVGIDRPINKL